MIKLTPFLFFVFLYYKPAKNIPGANLNKKAAVIVRMLHNCAKNIASSYGFWFESSKIFQNSWQMYEKTVLHIVRWKTKLERAWKNDIHGAYNRIPAFF